MESRMSWIISMAVTLLVVGVIMPIAITYVASAGSLNVTLADGSVSTFGTAVNGMIVTLFTVLLPVIAIIGLIIKFVPRGN